MAGGTDLLGTIEVQGYPKLTGDVVVNLKTALGLGCIKKEEAGMPQDGCPDQAICPLALSRDRGRGSRPIQYTSRVKLKKRRVRS